MNVLDENIPEDQRQLLRRWRVPMRQVGQDVGHKGLADAAIIPLLRQLSRPTFFTRDDDFYDRALCHSDYCLAFLAVAEEDVANFVRRFLQHPAFGTYARRRGTVARVGHAGIRVWRVHHATEDTVRWLVPVK